MAAQVRHEEFSFPVQMEWDGVGRITARVAGRPPLAIATPPGAPRQATTERSVRSRSAAASRVVTTSRRNRGAETSGPPRRRAGLFPGMVEFEVPRRAA